MTQTREEKAAVLCAWANDEKVVVQFLQANTWITYYDRGRTMPPPVFDGSNWRIREKAKPVLLISKRESEQIQAAHARAEKAEAINKRLVELVKAAKFYADHGLSTPVYNKDGTCYFADEPLKKALAAFEEYGEAELP